MNIHVNRTVVITAAVAGLIGIGLGTMAKPAEIVEVPSPYPSAVEVIVPSPYPSLVEVAVIPEECQLYIDELLAEDIANLDFIISVYDAYLDFPDEDIAQFGRRVETLMTERAPSRELVADASACDR